MEVEVGESLPRSGKIRSSHEGGVLMVNLESLGRTAVHEIELSYITNEKAVVVDENARQTGLYGIINCVASVSIPVPHSRNSVGYRVHEFQELAPAGREE